MKINKLMIFTVMLLSAFSIPIHCMEQPSKIPENNVIPTLFDFSVAYIANAIVKKSNDNFEIMQRYLPIGICEINEKVISYMVNYLGKVEIFSNELLKLYQNNRENIFTALEFFGQFDFDAKIRIIECLINKLSNLTPEIVDLTNQAFTDQNKNDITNLLVSIIKTYKNINFYNAIAKILFETKSKVSKIKIEINYNIDPENKRNISQVRGDQNQLIINISDSDKHQNQARQLYNQYVSLSEILYISSMLSYLVDTLAKKISEKICDALLIELLQNDQQYNKNILDDLYKHYSQYASGSFIRLLLENIVVMLTHHPDLKIKQIVAQNLHYKVLQLNVKYKINTWQTKFIIKIISRWSMKIKNDIDKIGINKNMS